MDKDLSNKIRTALAESIGSEGCSCCEGQDHGKHEEVLAKLLKVKKHPDKSGYNWKAYREKDN